MITRRALVSSSVVVALLIGTALAPSPAGATDPPPRVAFVTSLGRFVLELWPEEAPATVASFLEHAESGFYDGLVFHRVIPYFMVQTGGYEPGLEPREPQGETLPNESVGGAKNLRGTVAMARLRDPDSARTQFFVNLEDNSHLDADGDRPGYTVFGRVVDGMGIIDRIGEVATERRGSMGDVPKEPVVIEAVEVLEAPAS